MLKSPENREFIDQVRGLYPFIIRDSNIPQPKGAITAFGQIRGDFQPETRFEVRSPDWDKIATPALDFLICCIGANDAFAEDTNLSPTLPSGERVYRNAGALGRLIEATQRIVRFDASDYNGGILRPFPLLETFSTADFLHGTYLLALFDVLRKNPDAWLTTSRGITRIAADSRLVTWEQTFAGKWNDILVVKLSYEVFSTN